MHLRIRFFALIVFLLGSFVPGTLYADTPVPGGTPAPPAGGGTPAEPTKIGLTNPLNKIDSLPAFLDAILRAVVEIGTIVLTLALVYVGFKFVTAQGNQEKLSSARSALMWTVIGGLILLGAQTLGLVIRGTVESLQ